MNGRMDDSLGMGQTCRQECIQESGHEQLRLVLLKFFVFAELLEDVLLLLGFRCDDG